MKQVSALNIEWLGADSHVAYPEAVAFMERRALEIHENRASEAVWLVEHPPLYTAGTSAKKADLLAAGGFPVYETGRGGQYTYHGPGQRVAYVMLNLAHRGKDVRAFVQALEGWLALTLAEFGVTAEPREGRIGLWVARPDGTGEDKIAALGIRLRKWVSYHGVALNVHPNLSHFSGIVPCGIREARYGVTSLHALGIPATMGEVDAALKRQFIRVFT